MTATSSWSGRNEELFNYDRFWSIRFMRDLRCRMGIRIRCISGREFILMSKKDIMTTGFIFLSRGGRICRGAPSSGMEDK